MTMFEICRAVSFVACALTIASADDSFETPSSNSDSRKTFPYLTIALDFAGGVLNDVQKILGNAKLIESSKPMDCAEIYLTKQQPRSGLYDIWPRSRVSKGPLKVFCDMENEGGGWTRIQRRGDFDSGEDFFYRDWNSYKEGFGDLLKDFWIGNDHLFAFTNQRENVLKIILEDWEGNTTYATYDKFWIDDEAHNYTLHVKSYRGTAGDSFRYHDGHAFSTKDRDNDKEVSNCAVVKKGAWWYTNCLYVSLNGQYLKGELNSTGGGIHWQSFRGYKYSLKNTVMQIRPTDFR